MSIQEEVMGLLHRVPRLNDSAIPGGATELEIMKFETRTGIELPAEMREWLHLCNGPRVYPGGILGIGQPDGQCDIELTLELHPTWRDNRWLPVAADECGNYYVMDLKLQLGTNHPIYFIDHEVDYNTPDIIVASGLWLFLRFLLWDEVIAASGGGSYWPFDEQRVAAEDPALSRYVGNIPFGWDEPEGDDEY